LELGKREVFPLSHGTLMVGVALHHMKLFLRGTSLRKFVFSSKPYVGVAINISL